MVWDVVRMEKVVGFISQLWLYVQANLNYSTGQAGINTCLSSQPFKLVLELLL